MYSLLSLPIVLVLRTLVRPIIRVRFTWINESRIGLLARDIHLNHLRSLEWTANRHRRDLVIYVVGGRKSANAFLSKMWKRNLRLIDGTFGQSLFYVARKIPGMTFSTVPDDWDFTNLQKRYSMQPTFSQSELCEGENFLKSVNCNSDNKFVCLLVRDNAYIKARFPSKLDSYTSYRNTNIDTYVSAAEALANMGYLVFRMGAAANLPLISSHPKIIDYATNGMRSEFLDVFLSANCAFFISTGTGLDEVAKIFQRQISYVNFLPIFENLTYGNLLMYPKLLRDKKTDKLLTFRDIVDRNLHQAMDTKLYDEANLRIIDLSPEEILAVSIETANRTDGTWRASPDYLKSVERLKTIYRTTPKLFHNQTPVPSIAGSLASCFLEKYPNFLD